MTELYPAPLTVPTAELGPENPLPPLVKPDAVASVSNAHDLPADLAAGLAYGRLDTVLPCLLQDGYTRNRRPRELPALVLENDRLRATVLPSLGGRLWSLAHKPSGRELLFRNPVLQPANLALRDAWFAGGVEWNLGSTGHTTLTCAPMFAAAVEGPDGTPVLRLWEWERTRDLPYQLDFWLPEGSEHLFVGVRIRNPNPHDVPVYWWSNTAVPQTPSTRVLAPASQAWHYGYSGRLDLVDVPGELTYPARSGTAADYFFEVASDRPWIAALDETGTGFGQASTARLRGRKLFVWGESVGGRRWQEWLAPGAETGYLEIQAGLARTQLEHLRLPPGESWDWLEAYGPVAVDPARAHGDDWQAATDAVAAQLPSAAVLGERHRTWQRIADAEPGELLATGSGWGALEIRRMVACQPGTPFPEGTLGDRQRPWLQLLDGGTPQGDPRVPPAATLVNRYWADLLEHTADNWLTWYHRGVARWAAGDREAAREAWRASVAAAENAWALRNLAVAAGDPAESARLYRRALELAPDLRPLLIEALSAQLAAGLAPLSLLPERADGRFALLTALTRHAAGDDAGAKAVFDGGFEVPNIREGETSLSDTWEALSEAPMSSRYDFRMK
ncbi:DUF5107 domain-containing protein [Amycolatopsis sp. CA-128772]|uniref:DUF5107 domain-containing protein n=1 Tax=Amycolatopsis sp. CA-128772 TaxID=2073159 RepID=UPI000CD1B931|nr:DUF5107 domain-containing protein [Amycolatopsis sp. CA-128772]